MSDLDNQPNLFHQRSSLYTKDAVYRVILPHMRYLLVVLLLLSAASLRAQKSRAGSASDDRHIVTFTPFGFIVSYKQFNPCIGFDYEYMLSKDKGIGLHLPFAFGYEGPEQNDFYSSRSYRHTTLYAAPGIRFHAPFGGHAEFITGPGILLGNTHFEPYDTYYGDKPFDYGVAGLIADNTLNIYNRHFVFGFDVRVGTMVEQREDTRFFLHIGMHFGGRF